MFRRELRIRSLACLLCLSILTIVLAASTYVSATSANQTIASNQAYTIEIIVPSDMTVEFEVKVYSGPNVNIFLLDESNILLFNQGKYFVSYDKGTFLGTSHASWDMSLKDGTYYLVISRIGTDGTASSFVNYSYANANTDANNIPSLDLGLIVLVLIVVTALIVVLIVGLLFSRKKEASTEAASVSHAPPGVGTKYCRYCGSEMSADASHCNKCGKKLD